MFEYLEWAKGTEPAKAIAKGQRDTIYNVMNFVTVLPNIIDVREVSRSTPVMQQIDTETTLHENDSSIEQQLITTMKSRKYTETKTVTTASGWEIYGEVSLEVSGGLNIPFLTKGSVKTTAKGGGKKNSLDTTTVTKSEEITVTIPSQIVKCPPYKKMNMTWNYFSVINTIEYELDMELDPDNSYFGLLGMEFIRENDNSLNPVSFKRQRVCTPLSDVNDDVLKSMSRDTGISKRNGKLILKNFPVQITIKGYHGQLRNKEMNLRRSRH